MQTKVLEIDLKNIAFIPWDKNYSSYRILVRADRKPIGWLKFNGNREGITADEIQNAVLKHLGKNLIELEFDKFFVSKKALNAEPISVIVCTRNRTTQLANCLQYLLAMDYPEFEIIVVDNAPDNDDTWHLVSNMPVVYVPEPRPGLDWARNAGIRKAKYPIVAFTDDDVKADRYWLLAIAQLFQDNEVMGASGFVAPAEMETDAQHLFELGFGGMGHGFVRRFLRKETLSRKQRLWASNFGIGANMAFRSEIFKRIGGFDTALDVGTPSNGSGDVEFFYRVVSSGHLFVYDPSMLIWHYHRREMQGLKKQIFDNGRSFGCYLIDCYRKKTTSGFTILSFFIKEWLFNWNLKNLLKSKKIPRKFTLLELYGMMTSPMAYRKTKKRDKEMKRKVYESVHIMTKTKNIIPKLSETNRTAMLP